MEKIRITNLDRYWSSAAEMRPIGGDLGVENLAMFYYELETGDSFLWGGTFRYEEREEIIYIQHGTVTFETEEGDVKAEAGDVVRFAPGEWKGGTNTGTERAVALLIGAPQDRDGWKTNYPCPECGKRTRQDMEMAEAGELLITMCAECGTEFGRFSK